MVDLPRARLKTLVFDTEALRPKNDMDWGIYRSQAGVSVAVTIDYETGIPTFYSASDSADWGIDALARALEEAAVIVSYNGQGYDIPVISGAVGGRVLGVNKHVDLWTEIKRALGSERWPPGSWRLGAVCERTIGMGKGDEGPMAPSLWKDQKIGRLLTYCYNDVFILWRLCKFIKAYGFVVKPDGKKLEMRLP